MSLDIAAFTTSHPERPPVPVPVDWAAVERWLGLRLPEDYKQLADAHGPLDFGEYVWIHVPCVQEGSFDYGRWLKDTHREARIAARRLTEDQRPAIHPDPGGLLAWGCTRGSDVLFWDTSTSDNPDEWTVVVNHSPGIPGNGLQPWHHYDLTLGDYLRHTIRAEWELPSPPGPLIGPLSSTVARSAFLPTVKAWTPPEPTPPRLTDSERHIALQTGTGLDALRLLCPPPEDPYLGDGTWAGLFDELGTTLPSEYVTFMDLYGAGCWNNWLRFHTPLRTGERRFLQHIESTAAGYRQLKGNRPQWYPLGIWPEPGGFLPFANSIDGDQLGWLTEGDSPDDWPLIVWPRHADQGPPLPDPLIETLLAWSRGKFSTPGLAPLDEDDDPVEFAGFESWDDRAYW
ncbi:SMI1/KNR4 family protein [Streptomyces sp. MS06]|uniref:SMI1/KNR4 family protein n=1 Tax=Streptomyces sp. MS06 TaxID=3385974 RepID=UPI0039A3A476